MADNKFDQFKGNVKETVGNVTDNKELEKKVSKIKRLVKKKVVENAKNKITDAIDKLKK